MLNIDYPWNPFSSFRWTIPYIMHTWSIGSWHNKFRTCTLHVSSLKFLRCVVTVSRKLLICSPQQYVDKYALRFIFCLLFLTNDVVCFFLILENKIDLSEHYFISTLSPKLCCQVFVRQLCVSAQSTSFIIEHYFHIHFFLQILHFVLRLWIFLILYIPSVFVANKNATTLRTNKMKWKIKLELWTWFAYTEGNYCAPITRFVNLLIINTYSLFVPLHICIRIFVV